MKCKYCNEEIDDHHILTVSGIESAIYCTVNCMIADLGDYCGIDVLIHKFERMYYLKKDKNNKVFK